MDLDIAVLFGICVVIFILVVPIVALVRSGKLIKKAEWLEQANLALREELRGLTVRIHSVEKKI